MLNKNSDWPHGSVDAAFIIAFAWCFSFFSPILTFAVTCNVKHKKKKRKKASWWCKWCLWALLSPTETNIWKWFLPHQDKQPIHCYWQSPRTDGSKSRERAAAVLTTFAGQGGVCQREREEEGEEGQRERRGERRWLEHNRFQLKWHCKTQHQR